MWVKICGCRTLEAAQAAAAHGADAIGLVFVPGVRRQITPAAAGRIVAALPPDLEKVGLFVDADPAQIAAVAQQVGLTMVQLHGQEAPETAARVAERTGLPVLKALHMQSAADAERTAAYGAAFAVTLDGFNPAQAGGTGTQFDWQLARLVRRRFILAGGLTPDNVAEAILVARPWGVDVSSGVETGGEKDPQKIAAFIRAARSVAHDQPAR